MRSVFSIAPGKPEACREGKLRGGRRRREVPLVELADRRAVARVIRAQGGDRVVVRCPVAETPGEAEERRAVALDRIDRLIVLEPQPVLDRPQEGVTLRERA